MSQFSRAVFSMGVVAAWLASASPIQAGFNLITTRTGSDTITWGQLGAQSAAVPSPSSVTSSGGASGVVSHNGSVQRLDQSSGWGGNFATGDQVLFQSTTTGSITVFLTPAMVLGGAQIQSNTAGNFTAQVEALNSGGSILATFNAPGSSVYNASDNTAIFIGIQATAGSNFQALRFSTKYGGLPANFAINQFSFTPFTPLAPQPPVTATPLPPTIIAALLWVVGLGSLSLRRRLSVI